MRITLLKEATISHKAGETVEVTPARARLLIAAGAAKEAPKPAAKKTPSQRGKDAV